MRQLETPERHGRCSLLDEFGFPVALPVLCSRAQGIRTWFGFLQLLKGVPSRSGLGNR